MITNGGWAPAHQPHWCNTYQDIIGTVGAPDQDTIIAQNINLKCSCSAIIFSAQKKSLPAIKRSTWIICETCNWQNFWLKSNKTRGQIKIKLVECRQICWLFILTIASSFMQGYVSQLRKCKKRENILKISFFLNHTRMSILFRSKQRVPNNYKWGPWCLSWNFILEIRLPAREAVSQ